MGRHTSHHIGHHTDRPTHRPNRARWAAIGAAVAVTLGAGGLSLADAADHTPSGIVTIDPERILDTRTGIGLSGPFTSPQPRTLQVTGQVPTPTGTTTVVPDGATGVVLNVTAAQPTADGFISVRPDDATGTPETSNLNFTTGDIIPNSVTVALSPDGAIELTYDAFSTPGPTTDILVDVTGYLIDNDTYTTAEADARFLTPTQADTRYANQNDLDTKSDPLEVHASGAESTATLDPFTTANAETITTTVDGRLQITMRAEMRQECDLADLAVYYLVVNGEPVRSSLTGQMAGGFDGILFGATDDVVPAGDHTVETGAQCWQAGANAGPMTSGDYTNLSVLVVP